MRLHAALLGEAGFGGLTRIKAATAGLGENDRLQSPISNEI